MVERQKIAWLKAAPLLVDGLALAVLWLWGDTAVSTLQTPSGFNAIYLIGAYILMCGGVFLIRKLEPGPGGPNKARCWPGRRALCWALCLVWP